MANYQDITLALAGVCQAAYLVPQLANTGTCSSTLYQTAINSLFNTSPSSTLDVFGDIGDLQQGLRILQTIAGKTEKEDLVVIRYVFSALSLADKLNQHPSALEQISQRLAHITQYRDTQTENDEYLSSALSGIYSDIISPLTARIKVVGKLEHLQSSYIQSKVRTALFAAVRAGILWRQVGGTRWNLFFARKKILAMTQTLLSNH